MGNWKKLGVVPDSDDEGWDSEDSLQPMSISHTEPKSHPDPPNNDIWEFPGPPISPPTTSLTLQDIQTPLADLLSSVSATYRKRANRLLGEQQPHSSAVSDLQDDSDAPGPDYGSPDPSDVSAEAEPQRNKDATERSPGQKDEVSPSIVGVTAPSADPFLGSSPAIFGQKNPVMEHRDEGKRTCFEALANSGTCGTPSPTASESHPRERRSLRPRKPIQEHPYLLENAHYSKAFKSHGLRPIRITVAEQEAAKRRNEYLQDQEFTGDESQSGPDEEAQRPLKKATRRALDDELDELALSQSPRTSSPQRHLRASDEQSPGQQTDDTSVHDEEDFPDIKYLAANKKTSKLVKRRTPTQSSTSRKRPRKEHSVPGHESPLQTQNDAWDLPPSPGPAASTRIFNSHLSPIESPRPAFRLGTIRRSVSPLGQLSPSPYPSAFGHPIDLTALTAESEEERNVRELDGSSSDSESDEIRRTGRRIRGVLPASWLRLDQATRKKRKRTTGRKPSPPRSPHQQRPGLAMKRSGLSKTTVSTKTFLDDLNEGDDGAQEIQRGIERAAYDLGQEQDVGDVGKYTSDDNTSVGEDNFVDWMLPGQKWTRASSAGPPSKRKKIQQRVIKGPKGYRQPKISESVHHLDGPAISAPGSRYRKMSGRKVKRAISPPALSIVDVVEPDAPNFIKIATRAVTKRNNMGRSKPSNKSINLGNRTDNVDALSVLKRWTIGKIRPKAPEVAQHAKQQKPSRSRQPLQPVATNPRPRSPSVGLSFNQPQKLSRQISMDNSVSTGGVEMRSERRPPRKTRPTRSEPRAHDQRFGYRPAQLEADVLEDDDVVVFGVKKKLLDFVLRTSSRKEVLAPTFQLRQSSPDEESRLELQKTLSRPALEAPQLDQHGDSTAGKKFRSRKLIPPRRLDLDAPQYKHANDPLPFFDEPPWSIEENAEPQFQRGSRITGLGPFGTHYTQHFDVFPLHDDTFFHHTTIIGDGTLQRALGYRTPDLNTCNRHPISFDFLTHHFQWGRWTDTTSSELGLLFDLIAENVGDNENTKDPFGAHQVVDGAGSVLRYVLEFVSVDDESELRSFTQRMLDLLGGFVDHALHLKSGQRSSHVLLQITSRFLVCALAILRLCQGTVEFSTQVQQAEHILKRLANDLIEKLLRLGLSDVRTAYDDLQRLRARERGIRAGNFTTISWVIVMKVLGSAQIPKAGFWDLVSCAMMPKPTHIIDAQGLENLWRDMFTFLPLSEFDDAGVLSKGMRYVAPLQGWSLPQQLLQVVFESYQANQRQSPNFNEYCRALLGRCHYLIDSWGWQKCTSIVGTIFDFFGHQSLAHLRNEQAFKSPRFLEELSNGPCLSIEPEDRCFHIFLKILAVAIQSMKRRGLYKDIQNLVTRCLPNHNRQYSKEQTIHSHDLASLRNHHDLLCTLFWVAPPEFRRPVTLIEGLVRPASSHKEACLINLRAWSQLTRFVVSSGSSIQDYRPFISWQNNVFHQVLNQYLSAAADVEQQFMSMAKEDRSKFQKQFLENVIAANQDAAKDVLYFSVVASLDVIKHCPSLTAATFSFNVSQMTKTFNKLSSKGVDLDWGILRASFDIVDVYVSRLESLWRSSRESTGDSVPMHCTREFEDAIEFLDDKVVQSYIAAVRKAMLSPACNAAAQPACLIVERAVISCGRIASLFIDGGKSSLLHFFSAGKYGLFETIPGELGLTEWRFLPLFVATLLRNHVFSFSSVDCSHFDIWISLLVKPFRTLHYAVDLAETLQTLDMGYMKGTRPETRTPLDYSKNRHLFAGGISYMRKEVRQADFAQRRPTKAKYESTLKSVMRQIKSAIKSLELNSTEHLNYISFVREIVASIKSYGADICSIDPFFYQVSAEYSPPEEDPQMHTAGILAYGIRLGEGQTTAIPQLFSYLYNHFKTSLASDRLDSESKIIENSMKDDNILAFVIGRMLPAIIQASSHSNDIWPLLGVYAKALHDGLTRSCLPREIPEDAVDDAVALLTTVLNWAQSLRGNSTELTPVQAHIFTQLLGVCNAIRPSLNCWMLQSLATISELRIHVAGITRVAQQAAAVLCELRVSPECEIATRNVSVKNLILEGKQLAPIPSDNYLNIFTQNLIREVQSNWVVTPDAITVRVAVTPSTQRGAQGAQGVKNNLDSRAGLLSDLLGGLKAWVSELGEEDDEHSQRRKRRRPRRIPMILAT